MARHEVHLAFLSLAVLTIVADYRDASSFDEHLQDVVDILEYLLGDEHNEYDAERTLLFHASSCIPRAFLSCEEGHPSLG